jgi:hypothetical protein
VTPCTRGARKAWRADGVTRDFTFRGKLYRYPGPGGWHFVDIGRKHAGALRARPKETKVGWGYIPVRAHRQVGVAHEAVPQQGRPLPAGG